MAARKVFVAAVAFAAGLGAIGSSAVEAKPDVDRLPLILTSFVQNDMSGVARNQILEFRFSTPLRKGSVNRRSFQVYEVTPEGPRAAEGARVVKGNVVLFDPRRSQNLFDLARRRNWTLTEFDRPDGLSANTLHQVLLPASWDSPVLRSRIGRPLARPFIGTFSTGHVCFDAAEGQPRFSGDHGTGLLGFHPPRSGATGLVDADAVVVVEFSEPINPQSLVPGQTLLVTRITTGEQVPGTVIVDPETPGQRRFLFSPDGGFGFDVENNQGWDIQVTVTKGVTDIALNPLVRAVTLPVFRTRVPN
jgi:hypothetical protein